MDGSGAATGATAVGGGGGGSPSSNPLGGMLGLSDEQLAQLQRALSAAGSAFSGTGGAGQAGFMRTGPAPQTVQGQPNNLMSAILQMRANQAAAMGQPYQTGLAAPAVSLLR